MSYIKQPPYHSIRYDMKIYNIDTFGGRGDIIRYLDVWV